MLSSLLTLASGSKKSLFFTDYMNEPRASRRSRCNSSSTAPHIRSPRPHTPSSFPYPGHPPTHIHLPFCPRTCTLGPSPQPEPRNLLCACRAPLPYLCSHSAPVHVQGGVCAHSSSCAFLFTLSCIFLLAQCPPYQMSLQLCFLFHCSSSCLSSFL